MPPLRAVRRLVMAPLVVAIAAALAVLTPPLALLSAAFNLVRRGGGRVNRMRTLRVACFALAWFVGETAALTVLLCLWIASGFGGRLDTEPYQSRHYAVMRWFLGLIYRTAQRTCGLRVEAAGPMAPVNRPLIVLSRHAGPGDSLLLVHHLLGACGRRPRVVMKAALQLDPSLDVVANRLPNAFLHRKRAGTRTPTDQIRRLAAALDGRGALLLFPEGGNWTPLRWRRSIARLRRQHRDELAERAAAMPSVLPPRGGGALAAIAACPAADVIFVAHTGLDRLVSARDVWHSLAADIHVRARWWRVPASEVPRGTDHETQLRWLYDWWQRIDAWITSQHAGQRLPPRHTGDSYPERRRLAVDGPRLPRQAGHQRAQQMCLPTVAGSSSAVSMQAARSARGACCSSAARSSPTRARASTSVTCSSPWCAGPSCATSPPTSPPPRPRSAPATWTGRSSARHRWTTSPPAAPTVWQSTAACRTASPSPAPTSPPARPRT